MKINRYFGIIVSSLLLFSVFHPTVAASEKRQIQDESIYDLLVDRYFNGDAYNDEDVDTRNQSAFSGGDFAGIVDRIDYIKEMGFTMLSLGPVFLTETYDGGRVLNYEKIEPHFGSDNDLFQMIEVIHEKDMSVLVDFPFGEVSENHVWVTEGLFSGIPSTNGKINWDSTDVLVKEALKNAVVSFAEEYEWDGLRFTNIQNFDSAYMNEVIAAVKEVKPDIYIVSNQPFDANFDAAPNPLKINALKESFITPDRDSSSMEQFDDQVETEFIQLDDLIGPRFTFDMTELRMFPPTRWKLATTALFTLPGIPVVTYGSEIAVNGKEAPESHPITNFKTDMELNEYISDLAFLRNESEALRNGEYELLHNENGFMVYTRSNQEETWIIAVNNKVETSSFKIPIEYFGEKKKLRGVLNQDMIRESKDGFFHVVLDREMAEVYIVDEDKGFNTPYLIASILVYVLFLGFLFVVWKRGRKGQETEE